MEIVCVNCGHPATALLAHLNPERDEHPVMAYVDRTPLPRLTSSHRSPAREAQAHAGLLGAHRRYRHPLPFEDCGKCRSSHRG